MNKSKTGLKRIIAVILLFVVSLLLVSEVAAFTLYGIPFLSIQMFQVTGISIQSGITLAELSLSDFSVMFMMWIAPCIFCIAISVYLHCKLIMFVLRKSFGWLKVIFQQTKEKSEN